MRFAIFSVLLVVSFASCKKNNATRQISTNDLVETTPLKLVKDSSIINSAINGMYVSTPAHYNETTKNYPLLLFIHGAGQIGTVPGDLTLLLNDGVAQLIYIGKFPPSFTVKEKNYSFIILNPQFNRYPSSAEVEEIITYATQKFRIDATRIYISGLSMGGFVTTQMGADHASQLAAIVPISGVLNDSAVCHRISSGKLPLWTFHNDEDPTVNISTVNGFMTLMNSFNPIIAPKLTIFKAEVHDAWTQALNPTYKENGSNIYEWMLGYSR